MTLNHRELSAAGDILIVDDSPENLKLLKSILTEAGYRVRPAGSGEHALQSVHARAPVLILLDIRMPGIDGFEVCRRLKASEETQAIPVIFVSALNDAAEKVQGFELGGVDYVTKPINPQEVLMRIATHLSLYVTQQHLEAQNRQLQELSQYARSLIEASLDPLVTISASGQITDVNAATEKITGLSRDMLIGSDFADYFTMPEQARASYQQVFSQGFVTDYPLAIRHVSGKVFDVLYNASVYGNNQGNVRGVLATARDITERKKVEAALIQAKNHAEAANIAKSTFISTMSHELRTPLNAILGFSELMSLDEGTTAQQKETLDIINRSGTHLLNMINDVLDISKIEAGRLELNIQAFDLIKFLQEIGETVNVRATNKRLSFYLEIAEDMQRFVEADSRKLRQVLINLLENAIKFTPQGTVTLRTHSQPSHEKTITLTIEVLDTGVGIATDKQNELFKPFVQIMQANSDTVGTGLGLAISKSLVELMGGQISVSSVLNVGSTFKIELPVVLTNDIVIEENDHRSVKCLAPSQPAWRLLVVDDNVDNRLLLTTLLTGVGFQMREAENGQEAVYLFEKWQPHLIWMDMRMPVMDGYEATEKIRQLAGGDQVKIIALTASAFKEQRSHIIEAGCDGVVNKPFHMTEIFAALIKYLGVKFIYQDAPAPVVSAATKITAEMLMTLPLELRQRLYNAALQLDVEEADTAITQIKAIDPDIADGLEELEKNYYFEDIIQLLTDSTIDE